MVRAGDRESSESCGDIGGMRRSCLAALRSRRIRRGYAAVWDATWLHLGPSSPEDRHIEIA